MTCSLHNGFFALLVLLGVLQSGSLSLAEGPGSGVETSNAYVDVLWLMREARDPARALAEKSAAAQKGLEFIRSQVGTQLPIKNLDELPAYFAAHPELNQALSLNSTKGLGRVVTEFNLLLNEIRAGEKLKDCDDGKHSTGVRNGMAGHDPCQGNRNVKTNIYTKTGMNGDKVEYGSPMPAFVKSNVGEILAYSMMINFFDEKNNGKDPFRPTLEQVKKANPESKTDGEFSTSAVLAEVRGQTYKQAIAREVRNRMSLVYQYKKTPGGKSWEEMKGLISSAVKEDCKHCTPAMSDEIEKTVQGAIVADLNHKALKKNEDPAVIAEQLCGRMKASGFPFKGGLQEQEVRSRYQKRRVSILKGIHDVKFDLQLINQQEMMELNDIHTKRKAILEKMIQEGGDGLLFLTNAMSELSGASADETKLECTDSSKSADAAIVSAASTEAIGKTKEYAGKLNSILKPGNLAKESQKAELDELLKIAPGAVGEALNYSHPFAASLVCSSLKRLKREDDIQALQDGAVMWGATVVGVVAIIASSGAATPYVAAAGMAASAVAGLGAAAYSWDQSGEAEKLALEYRDAAIAQGGDPDLLNLSKEEFLRFKEQRFNAVLSGAFSAVEFAGLIAAGAKAGKSMAEINQEIERIIANPKEKGNWFKQNAKVLAADAAMNTAISSAANGYITGDFTPDPAQIAMGMVIGAGVRKLGKSVTPEESTVVRDRMNSLRSEMKRSLKRDPTPDELVAAYSKTNLEPVEIVASKPKENPNPETAKAPAEAQYTLGTVTSPEDGSWYMGYDKISATDAAGKEIGFLSYTIDEESKILTIGLSKVDEAHRGLGHQTKMFERMFAEHPEIKTVRTSLDEVNQATFSETLAKLVKSQNDYVSPTGQTVEQKYLDRLSKKGRLNEKELNECCADYLGKLQKSDPARFEALMDGALKSTPAWRTREKFGFSEFGEIKNYNFTKSPKDGSIDFKIEFDAVKGMPTAELPGKVQREIIGQGGNTTIYRSGPGTVDRVPRSEGGDLTHERKAAFFGFVEATTKGKDLGLPVIEHNFTVVKKGNQFYRYENGTLTSSDAMGTPEKGGNSAKVSVHDLETGYQPVFTRVPEVDMKNAIKMDEYLSELKRLRQADPKTLGSADLQKKAELEKSYPEFLSFVDQTAGFSKIGDFAPHQAVLDPATGKFLLIDLSANHKKVIKENGEWFEVSTRNPSDRKALKKTEKSIWSPYLKSRDYDPKTEADIQSTVRKSRGFGVGSPP